MIATFLGIASLALSSAISNGGATPDAKIPNLYVGGEAFQVELTFHGGDAGMEIPAWELGPAAFEVDGKPLGDRSGGATVPLPKGAQMTLRFDLAGSLPESGAFQLAVIGGEPQAVSACKPAPAGLDYMQMTPEQLKGYRVLLRTNQGDMMVEFLPDVAPNHVRNFLDLSASGFYQGTLFHRVSPTFMIQGGCPNTKTDKRNTWGTGRGPRMLDAEFNDTKHVRGILSMARGGSPNSASSQFFIMSADSLFLDHQYSAFGRLVSGYDTLDKIANAKGQRGGDGTVKPTSPQRIERAIVLEWAEPTDASSN